jgi:hypothetical protein
MQQSTEPGPRENEKMPLEQKIFCKPTFGIVWLAMRVQQWRCSHSGTVPKIAAFLPIQELPSNKMDNFLFLGLRERCIAQGQRGCKMHGAQTEKSNEYRNTIEFKCSVGHTGSAQCKYTTGCSLHKAQRAMRSARALQSTREVQSAETEKCSSTAECKYTIECISTKSHKGWSNEVHCKVQQCCRAQEHIRAQEQCSVQGSRVKCRTSLKLIQAGSQLACPYTIIRASSCDHHHSPKATSIVHVCAR